MPVRGIGIRDIGAVPKIGITNVLNGIKSTKYRITPKRKHYDRLEIDEFQMYVWKKRRTKGDLSTPIIGKIKKSWHLYGGKGGLKTAQN
jgi:hypothetical protein